MALSARAKKLVAELTHGNLRLGDLKQRGKEIKKDHDLAMELWSTGEYFPRLKCDRWTVPITAIAD